MNQRKPMLQLLLVDSISRRQRLLLLTARLLADVAVVAGANAALSTRAAEPSVCSFLALFFCPFWPFLRPPSTKTRHTQRPNAVSASTTIPHALQLPQRPLTAIKKHVRNRETLSHSSSGRMPRGGGAGGAPDKPGTRSKRACSKFRSVRWRLCGWWLASPNRRNSLLEAVSLSWCPWPSTFCSSFVYCLLRTCLSSSSCLFLLPQTSTPPQL
jgi:hypothetical protein